MICNPCSLQLSMFSEFKRNAIQMYTLFTEKLHTLEDSSEIKRELIASDAESDSDLCEATDSLEIEPVEQNRTKTKNYTDTIKLEMLNDNSMDSADDVVYLDEPFSDEAQEYYDDVPATEQIDTPTDSPSVHPLSPTDAAKSAEETDVFDDYVSTSEDDEKYLLSNKKPLYVVNVVNDTELEVIKEVIKCTICGHTYTTLQKFKKHMFNKHNTKNVFEGQNKLCSECGMSFIDNKSLESHKMNAHLERVT